MTTKTRSKSLVTTAFVIGLWGTSAFGAGAQIVATVTRTLVQPDGTFGGCMAALSVSPSSVLPSCLPNWVTFSCTGDFGDVVLAYRELDQAQLALAGGHQVVVQVDDSRKHNGYCYAYRIDVLK